MLRTLVPLVARLVAALAALALLALGVVVMVEAVAAWSGEPPVVLPADVVDTLESTAWSDTVVRWSGVAAIAVGLVLLAVGMWHRPPLTVATSVGGVRVERHGMERTLAQRLDRVDGVSSARVRAGRRMLRVRVDTRRRVDPTDVVDRAREEVERCLERLALDLRPKVSLRRRGGPRGGGSS